MLGRMAWRNAWRNPRRTGVVVAAVAVGIAGVVLTMATNYGMIDSMIETAVETELGHAQVHAAGYDANPELAVRLLDGGAQALTAVAQVAPGARVARRVRGEALVTSARASGGVRVIGVEPAREAAISTVAHSVIRGRWLAEPRRAMLGERLARRLEVDVGDRLVVSVQELGGDLTAEALRVGGIFRTPLGELDGAAIFLRLEEAQRLFGLGAAVSELVVRAEDRDAADLLIPAIAARLPDAEVRSWKQIRPVLVYMVQLFDQQAVWVYVAVFVAMAFGIANVLLMAIYERVREIGVMRSLGMGRARLVAAVMVEALIVTLVGLALGFLGAAIGVWALRDGIDLSFFAEGLSFFGVGSQLVPVLRWGDFGVPSAVAVVTALLASAWPAWRAVRLRPAEAVRTP